MKISKTCLINMIYDVIDIDQYLYFLSMWSCMIHMKKIFVKWYQWKM